jgi:hypothetical protein
MLAWKPVASNRSMKWLPMNPAPPVTRTVMLACNR